MGMERKIITFLICLYTVLHVQTVCTSYCVGSGFSLTFKNITSVNTTWFSGCLGASVVNISHNLIDTLSNDTFSSLWGIRELDLSFNRISVIPAGLMVGMSSLKTLDISHNNLVTLPLTFFLNKLWLESVDLSYNSISDIHPAVFNFSREKLDLVILHHNNLTSMEPWAYYGRAIKIMDLRWNNISSFSNKANWTYKIRSVYNEALTDVRNNSFYSWDDDFYMQYKDPSRDVGIDTIMLELFTDMRENNWMCDCNMHNFAQKVSESMYRWTNDELLFMRCYDPPELRNKRVFYDIALNKFVCNLTHTCPDECLCQDRPADGVINIDCRSRNLTEVPKIVPDSKYQKITMQLDGNRITRLSNVSYADKIYSLTMSNNLLTSIGGPLIETIARKEGARIDFSYNQLTEIPEEVQTMKFQDTNFNGNDLVCGCDMLWMKVWISLAPKYEDRSLNCTFEGTVYTILDLDEGILNCSVVGSIILIVVLTVVLLIVVVLLVTAKRCPYETKVLIYKIFRIHPGDKYVVDESVDKKYDMYISFDEEDPYVRQWLKRILVKQLEEKKPKYALSIAIRDKKAGSEAEARLDLIESSKRLMIILSKGYANQRWCDYEACQAETLEENKGRVMYVLYDTDAEALVMKEPWMSKTKDRKVFTLGERMFWSKIRYELPAKTVRFAGNR